MPEFISIGETMVMFAPEEAGRLRYIENYRKKIAGAESNVAITVSRLGRHAGFISALGDDEFGRFIYGELMSEGVDVSQIRFDAGHATGIMFKQIHMQRETSVYYYRANSAASHMTPDIVHDSYFHDCKLLHITGITPALSSDCRDTLWQAIHTARSHGARISFDPNLRLKLWSAEEAKPVLIQLVQAADIVLPGLDECNLLYGTDTPEGHADRLLREGASIAVIKLGNKGAFVASRKGAFHAAPYPVAQILDPIGAGDAFAAGFLTGLLEGQTLQESARMANAMGALALASYDDYQSLPDRRELAALLHRNDDLIYR